MKKWISIIVEQNESGAYTSFGFGLDIYIHQHYPNLTPNNIYPWHVHILITIAFWFIELKVGHDSKDSEAE